MNSNQLFTVVMYDISAPSSQNPINSPYVHYLAVNIPNNSQSGDIVLSYTPPSPPPNSGAHTYITDTYLQTGRISISPISNRANFPLNEFIQRYGLQLVDRKWFNLETNTKSPSNGVYSNSSWFNTNLNEQDEKYCRCILQVAGKQPPACNIERAWFKTRDGKKCVNPYAVCHSSVQRESGRPVCGPYYNFNNIPDQELIGYASLNRINIPQPYNREQMIENIYQWKYQNK